MSNNIYDAPITTPPTGDGSVKVCSVPSANIVVETRAFAGQRWFALGQTNNIGESESIAVSYGELKELVSLLIKALDQYKPNAPEQLRLFDPDNPPEAPRDNRLDPAQ